MTHWLAQHCPAPPLHALPQPPQLSGSVLVSMQKPLQQVPPPGQPPDASHGVAHCPADEQLSPDLQSSAETHWTHWCRRGSQRGRDVAPPSVLAQASSDEQPMLPMSTSDSDRHAAWPPDRLVSVQALPVTRWPPASE